MTHHLVLLPVTDCVAMVSAVVSIVVSLLPPISVAAYLVAYIPHVYIAHFLHRSINTRVLIS